MNMNQALQSTLIQARDAAKEIAQLNNNLRNAKGRLEAILLAKEAGISTSHLTALGTLFNADIQLLMYYVNTHFGIKIGEHFVNSIKQTQGSTAYSVFRSVIIDGTGEELETIVSEDPDAKAFMEVLSILAELPDVLGSYPAPLIGDGLAGYRTPGFGQPPYYTLPNQVYCGSPNMYDPNGGINSLGWASTSQGDPESNPRYMAFGK